MGFFSKTSASSYPARRNRIQQQQGGTNRHHPATVNPQPYGAHDPAPIAGSVYQSNGIPVAVAPTVTSTATAATAATYGAAPVQATAYVPGQAPAAATTAPVVATAYVPGSVPAGSAAPVQASVYNPGAAAPAAPVAGAASSATNPLYQAQSASFNNGNCTYNTDESSFWECSVCTFPNLRSEASCKGCGSPIPPGMLMSAAAAQPQPPRPQAQASSYSNSYGGGNAGVSGLSSQMNGLGLNGNSNNYSNINNNNSSVGVMRVHIPQGMGPGQRIKVRSPDGAEVVKAIPPESEWSWDGGRPFFRMQFGAQSPVAQGRTPEAQAHEVPPPHSTAWRDFHCRAATRFTPPPLATKSVPHTPHGMGACVPPNGRHKSLIVGINYTGKRAQLRGCINDAKNMQSMLQRNGFPNDGSHMLLLTDERNRGREYQPTVEILTKAFAWFMKDVRKGDVLFFHFSGHGGQVPDKTGHEVDGFNETIVPLDYDRKGQISDDILWGSLVYPLPEGARLTALMDMCHSGTGLDLPFDYNVNSRRWKEDINPAHSAGDVVLFSGCEDSQTSADVQGGFGKSAGGAMTMAFMGAYQEVPCSTYHEFLSAVKRQLKRKRFSQRPQLTSSQKFDADSRIFSLGYASGGGGVPSTIEPNHNAQIGRMKRRHVRPARQGWGGGGGGMDNLFGVAAAAVGGALIADALF
ncbi:hypothetical protein ACHAWF_011789 [Thalassiosira exigua]